MKEILEPKKKGKCRENKRKILRKLMTKVKKYLKMKLVH